MILVDLLRFAFTMGTLVESICSCRYLLFYTSRNIYTKNIFTTQKTPITPCLSSAHHFTHYEQSLTDRRTLRETWESVTREDVGEKHDTSEATPGTPFEAFSFPVSRTFLLPKSRILNICSHCSRVLWRMLMTWLLFYFTLPFWRCP